MGWVTRLCTGEIIREDERMSWNSINIHSIEELWIEGWEGYKIRRRYRPGFLEFVQFKTAVLDNSGLLCKENQCIGWTNGIHEFLYRVNLKNKKVTIEIIRRIHFHPLSLR